MGLIKKASEHHEAAGHKKRPHKAPAPDEAPDGLGSGGVREEPDASDNEAPEGAPDGDADQGEAGGQDDGAGAVEPPQQPQGAEDGQSDDSESDESDQSDAGGQGGSPESEPGQGNPDQQTGQPASPADDTGGAGSSSIDLKQIPISPALQQAYQQANEALMNALYNMPGDPAAQAVLKGLFPSGPAKIRGPANGASTLTLELVKKLGLIKSAPQIILPFTKDVVSHVLDLGQQVKQIQYNNQEAQAVLAIALETVLRATGVTQQHVQNMGKHVPQEMLEQHLQHYRQTMHAIAPHIQKASQEWHHPSLAGGQGAGAPPQGGPPQGGPPQGGAPPAAAEQPPGGVPAAGGPGAGGPEEEEGQ